jgi:outer membrane biosynthesis protein TonB
MPSTTFTVGHSTQYGYALSFMLHAAVIAMAWTGAPFLKRVLPEESALIIDLVQIADISAAAPRPTPEADIEPVPETVGPTQADAARPSESMPLPPTKDDDIAFLNSLVKDLEKEAAAAPKTPMQGAEDQPLSNNFANTSLSVPTMSESDAIIRHIEGHWRIDPGKEGVDTLTVEVKINLSADGTVQQAQIMDMSRYVIDNAFRTFANSARNAVLTASPLPINPENAAAFRELTITFSPLGRIN